MFKIIEEQKLKVRLLKAELIAGDKPINQVVDEFYDEFNKGRVIKLPKFIIRDYCGYILYKYCTNFYKESHKV